MAMKRTQVYLTQNEHKALNCPQQKNEEKAQ
jgi:hypothetical protein